MTVDSTWARRNGKERALTALRHGEMELPPLPLSQIYVHVKIPPHTHPHYPLLTPHRCLPTHTLHL